MKSSLLGGLACLLEDVRFKLRFLHLSISLEVENFHVCEVFSTAQKGQL